MTDEESDFWREESSHSRLEILVFLCQIALIMILVALVRPLEEPLKKLKTKVLSLL